MLSSLTNIHRHYINNRLIIGLYRLPYLVLFVLLVATTKIHLKERALVVDTKQSQQAGKAVGPACFVLCQLLALALSSGFFTN
jgi:hypothetical protein